MYLKSTDEHKRDTPDLTGLVKELKDTSLALWIPILQALARAFTGGLLVWVVLLILGVSRHWAYGLVTFFAVLAWFVWDGIWAWNGDLGRAIQLVETVIQADLDGDRRIGPPGPQITHIEVPHASGRGWVRSDLLASPEQMRLLAEGVLNGRPLSEREWAAGPQRVFGQNQWGRLIEEMMKRGLIDWIDPDAHQQGVDLTESGERMMEYLAGYDALPSPTEVDVAE